MANRPKSMRQIRQILQQHLQGTSIRQIVKRTGSSRNTIRGYLSRWRTLGLTAVSLEQMNNPALGLQMLAEVLPEAPRSDRHRRLEEQLPGFVRELKRVGVARQLLWQGYRSKDPEGFGYTQFCNSLRAYLDQTLRLALLQILEDRYSKKPIIIASQLPSAGLARIPWRTHHCRCHYGPPDGFGPRA